VLASFSPGSVKNEISAFDMKLMHETKLAIDRHFKILVTTGMIGIPHHLERPHFCFLLLPMQLL
jgi:hypothetical protein